MKRSIIFLSLLIVVGIALVHWAIPSVSTGADLQQSARVDQGVLDDTSDGQSGHFLVVLRQQADIHRATATATNRDTRGRLAFDALRQSAAESQPPVLQQLESLGAKHRAYWIVNLIAVEGDRHVIDAIAARGDVQAIESDRAFRVPLESPMSISSSAPTLTQAPATIEWGVSKINAPAVWASGFTGQGIVYANADTGVQWDHPALKPHYRGWNGTIADHNYNWWDAIHPDSGLGSNICGFDSRSPCDDYGHGTHTMGTGVGDDGAGNQIGVAPGAKWIGCRNMDDGTGRPSTYIECFQFFMAPTDLNGNNPDPTKRPDVVGNSYDCPTSELCSANSLLTAMDNLRSAGVFMSVSAGNDGPSCSTVMYPPGLYDSAITAGAVDSTNALASFSSRGPVTVDGSGRRKPDLVAPGVGVRSSYPTNTYMTLSGTSMAAPHLAGAVALLWSALPQLSNLVDHTEYILEQTALHLTTPQGCGGDTATQVPNNDFGYGLLDVLAAYNYAKQDPFQPRIYLPAVMNNH